MAKTETKKRKDGKKKAKEERIANIKYAILDFKSTTENTREPNEGDEWDAGDTYTYWEIPSYFTLGDNNAYRSEPLTFIPEPGHAYYMVYAVWSTGDSFGHYASSNCECFGVYETQEKAEKGRKELMAKKNKVYRPWDEYFNSLARLEIQTIAYLA